MILRKHSWPPISIGSGISIAIITDVSLLAQFFTDPDLVEPVRDWYRKLFSRLGSLQKEEQPKAFLSVMALEGFFFTHKFGLDLMKPEEKEMVYQQILSFFLPGKSSDKVKKASKK